MSTNEIAVKAEATFYIGAETVDALMAKARELDVEENDPADLPEKYTLGQALQIVWHREPEWLHRNVLEGWTMERASDGMGGEPTDVWTR